MPLQISAFAGTKLRDPSGVAMEVPSAAPVDVTAETFTGEYTVPAATILVRLSGSGKVTWPGRANSEAFNGVEYRGVAPGDKFTVA